MSQSAAYPTGSVARPPLDRTQPQGQPSTHPHFRQLERAERVARRMDSALRLPFTRIRVGWDSLMGLVPGVGDTLAIAPAVWIIQQAHDMGVPKSTLLRMGGNLAVDWAIGLVPLLGDVFDVGFKANMRNTAILRDWVEAQHPPAPVTTHRDSVAP